MELQFIRRHKYGTIYSFLQSLRQCQPIAGGFLYDLWRADGGACHFLQEPDWAASARSAPQTTIPHPGAAWSRRLRGGLQGCGPEIRQSDGGGKEMSQSGLSPKELADAVEAFKHEAQMLASLQHPNLPRIYDHFSDRGRWYFVMDFIEGETLESYLLRQPDHRLSLLETLAIGLQLCAVLDYLHTRRPPVIFRDLKPANILSAPPNHLYLIDFGIARHFKPGQ